MVLDKIFQELLKAANIFTEITLDPETRQWTNAKINMNNPILAQGNAFFTALPPPPSAFVPLLCI